MIDLSTTHKQSRPSTDKYFKKAFELIDMVKIELQAFHLLSRLYGSSEGHAWLKKEGFYHGAAAILNLAFKAHLDGGVSNWNKSFCHCFSLPTKLLQQLEVRKEK